MAALRNSGKRMGSWSFHCWSESVSSLEILTAHGIGDKAQLVGRLMPVSVCRLECVT